MLIQLDTGNTNHAALNEAMIRLDELDNIAGHVPPVTVLTETTDILVNLVNDLYEHLAYDERDPRIANIVMALEFFKNTTD
jgi:hypothetical protein